ncbi:MAG: ABC transporter substrate-binding protein, partial [Bacillota bacterium]
MKRLRYLAALMVFALALVTIIGGCGQQAEEPEEPEKVEETEETEEEEPADEGPREGGTLIIAVSGDPVSLDPHLQADWSTRQSIAYMFDGLTIVGVGADGNEEIQPALARDWDISEDGLTYTWYLREDVLFHDGTPFNAEAVKFTYDRYLDPDFNANEHPHIVDRLESVEVVDEFTVQMNMLRVDIFWESSVASH